MNRWLKLLEAHVEKGVLGLAVVALGAMIWLYGINSPNKIKYGNSEVGPDELLARIKQDADRLEQAMRSRRPEPINIERFADKLRAIHEAGIFYRAPDSKAPPLVAELPRATPFGKRIEVPGLDDAEGQAHSVALVTPLPPSEPRMRTGRSLVIKRPAFVPGFTDEEEEASAEEKQPEEVAWVTVGAYYNKKAQFQEMIKAGYAPYRAKAYVVGLDVQRQEMLASGEFSDWQDVPPAEADPQLDLPEPVFNENTGKLANKDELREAFMKVKMAQPYIMEPDFYEVEAGDFWEMPPLPGYEEEEEKEEEPEPEVGPLAGAVPSGRAPVRAVPPPAGGRTGMRGGGGRMGGMRGGGIGGRMGQPMPGGGAARSEAKAKREARKAIRQALKDARKALGAKDYNAAIDAAENVLRNEYATKANQRDAKAIIKRARKMLERERKRTSAAGYGRGVKEVIKHPETGEPAVWFHDDSVEAGKTYRYRMRVRLWNRYVGQMRMLKNPDDARKTVIVGEWSYPSEPITVTPSTYFFLSGARPPDGTVSVDVWKWIRGQWIKQRFDVTVGDVIGGLVRNVATGELDEEGNVVRKDVDFTTGAVVLDLRFDEPIKERWPQAEGKFTYRDKTTVIMVYLDPADGQVKERAMVFDRRSPIKKKLEQEAW